LSDAKDKCPDGDCGTNQQAAEDGESANSRVNVTGAIAIGGLAVAAGGLVWYFVSKPQPAGSSAARIAPRRALTRVAPAFGRNFTGLAVAGSF
jgi:hypothetical protein